MGGFILPWRHKEFACFLTIPHLKWSNLCVLLALWLSVWEILPFSWQKLGLGYFAKGILQNFIYFPTKFICFMSNVLLFCIMFVFYQIICIKLNFMSFACLLSKLLFCGIFISKCQILCYMQCLAFLFNNKCVLLQRTLILCGWCFFENNILLFCSQPRIIACIMDFFGVQI